MTGVVVLNYNSNQFTVRCVRAILPALSPDDKIVVVDNASTDGSAAVLAGCFAQVKKVVLIQSEKNLGYSGGNNLGIKYLLDSGASYICICNPDIIAGESAIAILKDYLEVNKDVCCVGPLIYMSDGRISHDCARGFMGLKEKIFVTTPLNRTNLFGIKRKYYHSYDYSGIIDVFMISGSFMFIRADLLRKTGGFDERTFLFEEECILFFKISRNGYGRVVFNPECSVIHDHPDVRIKPELVKHFASSEQYYLKHYLEASFAFLLLMKALRFFQYLFYRISMPGHQKS